MRATIAGLTVLVVVFVLGCGTPPPGSTPPAAPAAAADAAMCAEHGVLEALCTKCKPALIPVFKARGDWCEEHGLPMSICPVHHPERGGRPQAELAVDDAPAEGTAVRLQSAEAARLAGIGTSEVETRTVSSVVTATARILYDADHVARINARAPGVIRSLRVKLGDRVRAGALLAEIESAEAGAGAAGLQAARSRLALARTTLERSRQLRDRGIVAEQEVLAAEQECSEAQAAYAAAAGGAGMVGYTSGGRYALTSPIAGVVTGREAAIGSMVATGEVLFEIVEPSRMWAELDVAEADLAGVAVGQQVIITIDGGGGREYRGVIASLSPGIDLRTRTAKARVPFDNADGALRANMFGRARIAVTGQRTALLVPRAAVQRARSVDVVFVALAADSYELRRVRRGMNVDSRVEVTGNLRRGERVVTDGAFFLKTETLRESIGAGCCPEEAGPS